MEAAWQDFCSFEEMEQKCLDEETDNFHSTFVSVEKEVRRTFSTGDLQQ